MLNRQQLEDLCAQMTLDEKIGMLHGDGIFETLGIRRLNIPPIKMSDGPMGVRSEYIKKNWVPREWSDDYVTYFPSNSALAATWNPEHAYKFGLALGAEARSRNKDVILAPGVNLMRSPLCGRNFEYMSEDPHLTKVIGAEIVKGIQENDVAACVKHFAANNQETNRMTVDAKVDAATLEELYLPAFHETLIEAGAYTVMGAYNKLNGDYCCESHDLLTKILKEKWGYEGVVISDWGGVHSTKKAALAGLDIEMNVTSDYDDYFFADALYHAVKNGEISESVIDEKVHRILNLMNKLNMLSGKRKSGSRNTPEHQKIAYEAAQESIVLLENDHGMLPIALENGASILVVGENAIRTHANGGGSAEIKALYEHTPFSGISMAVGGGNRLSFVPGYTSDAAATKDRQWELREAAIRAANNHDLIILVGGINHDFDTEGKDKQDIALPYAQNELIKALSAVNPNIIYVNVSGSAVDLSTVRQYAKAMIQTWYNGMEGGRALADVIFGNISPSGKMPFTMAHSRADYAAHTLGEFPGDETVSYAEGLFIGYRHTGANAIYPFGHGLSYTTFEYSKLSVDVQSEIAVTFTLKNTGDTQAKETIQVYIGHVTPENPRPAKELRYFEKISLAPFAEKTISFMLNRKAFMAYDAKNEVWTLKPGAFNIMIGASSEDIRLQETITL